MMHAWRLVQLFKNKKGKMTWEYLVSLLLVLVIIIVGLFMIDSVRNYILSNTGNLFLKLLDLMGL